MSDEKQPLKIVGYKVMLGGYTTIEIEADSYLVMDEDDVSFHYFYLGKMETGKVRTTSVTSVVAILED